MVGKLRLSLNLGIAALACCLSAHAGPVMMSSWDKLSDRDVGRLGKKVLKAGESEWAHGETSNFVYHVQSVGDMAGLADEVEYAYRKSSMYLGPSTAREKTHVFLVSPDTWQRVVRKADRRKDSLAMQAGRNIYVLQSTNPVDNIVWIPHEIIHLRLWEQYGRNVPVWLDEGLAGCLGWKIAQSYRQKDRLELVRTLPALKPGDVKTLDELTAVKKYPGGPGKAPAFYRQSEELIRAIARKIGYDKLAGFVKAVAGEGREWDEYLRDRFSFSEFDFKWLKEQAVDGVQ